jgi:zinc/manganese transport system permease protein
VNEASFSYLDYAFMRHALAGGAAIAVASAPLGVFLVIRRMSLTGEAMAHAVLPGVAAGYLLAGFSLPAMTLGGLGAGLLVALLAVGLSRFTALREDAALAGLYLFALALGALLISAGGRPLDLLHVLFGSALALDATHVALLCALAVFVLACLALLYRGLVIDTLDPSFLRVGGGGAWIGPAFLALVALTLVAGFQAMGTLMTAALMVLPAAGARLWTARIDAMIAIAAAAALASVLIGLLLAARFSWPAGPSVAVAAGGFFLFSCAFGVHDSAGARLIRRRHLEG